MSDLYQKILQKPKAYRRKLAYVLTGCIGIVFFSVWLISMSYSMKKAFQGAGSTAGQAIEDIKKSAPSLEDLQEQKEQAQQELEMLNSVNPSVEDIKDEILPTSEASEEEASPVKNDTPSDDDVDPRDLTEPKENFPPREMPNEASAEAEGL